MEYETLRNKTFIEAQSLGSIAPGGSHALPVPSGTGSADVIVSFAVVPGARNFGVSVRSGDVKVEVESVVASPSGGGHAVTVGFYAGPQPCTSLRGQPPCTAAPTPPPPTNATVQLTSGETLDVRVLVDRPIVEFYVNGGRAAFTNADANFSTTRTGVAVYNHGDATAKAVAGNHFIHL